MATITAFVRRRDGLTNAVTIIEGDVTDAAAVRAAMTGDAIVSTLGGGSPKSPGSAQSTGTANLVEAARTAGIRRILAVAGAGVLQADATRLRNEAPGYPPFLAAVSREHTAAYHSLRDSGLDWTLVCCPDIPEGPPGLVVARADYLPEGSGRVTTGAVAAFLLSELEAARFLRTRVGING